MTNARRCKWPEMIWYPRMYHGRARHRKNISVAALYYAIRLRYAGVCRFMRELEKPARVRNLLAAIGVDTIHTIATRVLIERRQCVIPRFGGHGVTHFKASGDVFDHEDMSTAIATHRPVGIPLDHMITRYQVAPGFDWPPKGTCSMRDVPEFSAHT